MYILSISLGIFKIKFVKETELPLQLGLVMIHLTG